MAVLGIETSCDETACALVTQDGHILAENLYSQLDLHKTYGGVVPEIAARAHVEMLDTLVDQTMNQAGLTYKELDAVAATAGPGLIGGLVVGLTFAKGLAFAANKPLLAINHLEAHLLTARLTHQVEYPFLTLLVSGGHAQILIAHETGRYERLGATIDDAAGEAFDKAAKMMGLGYPGGPAIEQAALIGDPNRFAFPRPLIRQKNCNFSFSGLKNALRLEILALKDRAIDAVPDLSASFQAAIADCLKDRVERALGIFRERCDGRTLVVAGGVAANQAIGRVLAETADRSGFKLVVPEARYCTDNGVMIAWCAIERLRAGFVDGLHAPVRPRWPLDPLAEPLKGAGVKA